MKNEEQPAYPIDLSLYEQCNIKLNPFGLTKREYFAAMAMQGLLANSFSDGSQIPLWNTSFEEISKMAVHQADAILTELEKAK